MPENYAKLLGPRQLADLTAWLLTLKKRTPLEALPGSFGFRKEPGRVVVTQGGRALGTYVYEDPKTLRPYFANVKAPDGIQVTRTHPPVKGKDSTDHDTMHLGIWLGFGDVNGADFWRNRARVEQARFLEEPAGNSFAVLNRFVAKGREICRQECRYTFHALQGGTLLAIDVVFSSDSGDLEFGEQEEMGLGLRAATSITVESGGRMLDSEGRVNEKGVWGKRAEWCDYSGVVEGRRIGLTLMPAPSNGQPCWFHARDYGALVANPFGRRAGGPRSLRVKKGEKLRLRFGVFIHSTPEDKPADVAGAYAWYKESLK